MAEGQILQDAIHIGFIDHFGRAETPTAFRAFALQQMALASAGAFYFAASRDLKTFGYCFSGFDTFWSSHKLIVLLKRARNIVSHFLGSKWQFVRNALIAQR